MDKIVESLKKEFWETLENEEGITKEDTEMVMLDIGFSPVIPFKGDKPYEVIETVGGLYQVLHPMFPTPIDAEMLKVMRYRYLSNRKNTFTNG